MMTGTRKKSLDHIKYDVSLGRILRKKRKEKNITQVDLSIETGINERDIKRYEYGDTSITIYKLLIICNALKIDMNEVINNI